MVRALNFPQYKEPPRKASAGKLAIVERIRESLKVVIWRRHARREAEDENISESMLEDALRKEFVLVEHYPKDPRGESALVLVFVEGRPVHVILSARKDLCYLVTTYLPDPKRWNQTFTRRRKG
jgi:hypothetical protein